ncbi:unnamed protein product [Mytilus coruscus]|uniref:Uncharacterized protein n=1 Tax=Mytilus coruscus TaxID=42192 RepID=A0A6J8ED18_MYTCO|nr:unnamed protein product [Mytilus coruscus]
MAFFIAKFMICFLFYYGQLWLTNGNEMPKRCYGSITSMSCKPIIPSFIQFYGWDLPNLEHLSLDNDLHFDRNQVKWSLPTLPSGLFNWASKIKHLYMDDVGLENLKCDIFQPLRNSLNGIRMDKNMFREFPSCAFENLNQLESILFRYQNLESVNINDLQLNSLTDIDLTRNEISSFSIYNISNNKNIRILLDENKISFLNISKVNRIRYLRVKENQLTKIYGRIFQYSRSTLEYLDLSYNALDDDVWNVLEGVTTLKTLKLQHNRFQTVSRSVFSHLSELYYLDLSHNYISVTDFLIRSGKITVMLFNSNKLVSFPTNLFDNTISFEDTYHCTLDISNNMMDIFQLYIPTSLRRLALNLGQNQLTAIDFENHNKIYFLNISSNHLTSLPATLPIADRYIISDNPLNTKNVLKHLTTTMKDATQIEMDNINFLCNRSEHYDFTHLQFSKMNTFSLRGNCIPSTFLCYIGSRTINVYLDNNKNHNNSTEDLHCKIHTKEFEVVSFSGSRMSEFLLELFMSKPIKMIANVISIYCKKCQLKEFPFMKYTSSKSLRSYIDLSENLLVVFNGLEVITFFKYFTLNLEHNQITHVKKVIVKKTNIETFCYFHLKFMNNSIANINDNRTFIELVGRLGCFYFEMSIDLSFNRLYELNLATIINNINQKISIQNLNVSHNNLEEYRDCLHNVWQFRILDLTYNKLRDIPDNSCRFALETYLGHNSITDISRTLPKASISKLDLEWNLIQYIYDDAFAKMTYLKTLNLRGNKLKNFPKAVQKLRYLTTLDISFNNITNLKLSDIGGIMNYLTSLILTGNELVNHPSSSIRLLSPFQELELTDNLIYCDCDALFLRNHTLNAHGRCSFPPEYEGYLVSCFPADDCVGYVPIYVYKETKSRCLYDDYFDIKISMYVVDENLFVEWKRLGSKKQSGIKMIAYRDFVIVKEISVNETGQTNHFFLPQSLNLDRLCIHAFLDEKLFERCLDVNYTYMISTCKLRSVSQTNSNNGAVYGTSAALVLSFLLNILGSIFVFVFIKFKRTRPINDANSVQFDNNEHMPNEYEISSCRRGAYDQQVEVYDQLSENSNNTGEGTYENLNI